MVLGMIKGEGSAQRHNKHDTSSPDISAAGVVGLICPVLSIVQQLWRHVLWRPATAGQTRLLPTTDGNKHDTSTDIGAAGIVSLICWILFVVQQLQRHVLWRPATANLVSLCSTDRNKHDMGGLDIGPFSKCGRTHDREGRQAIRAGLLRKEHKLGVY